MATQAERDYIIQQATARNPSNPQLALWQYAQSIGFSPAQIDEYMGWGAGTSQNWAQANGLAQPATPAFDSSGMTPIYAKKTIDGRGAPRQVDDTSQILGYMKNNGDGTYSNYSTTGALESTYNPNNGLIGGLSQNLNAIADDRSKVLSDFVVPATAMGVGASLVNGAGVAGSAGASEVAAGGSGGGLLEPASTGATNLFAGAGNSSGLLPAGETLSAGAVSTGAAGLTAAEQAMLTGGSANLGGLLTPGTVTAAGALAGALGGGNTTTSQTQSRDPWAPAQQYLRDNLQTNANMQANYLKNPFSNEQKAAYQNYANILANSNANVPVMSQISNNFLASRRGQMPTMPQFTNGATSGAIDWSQYQNMGLLK